MRFFSFFLFMFVSLIGCDAYAQFLEGPKELVVMAQSVNSNRTDLVIEKKSTSTTTDLAFISAKTNLAKHSGPNSEKGIYSKKVKIPHMNKILAGAKELPRARNEALAKYANFLNGQWFI